ncbi:SDR family oxidoreductase [Flavisphingomonas formosensis]|uniref:SDR family oxidoreductase n=1 Tax=Flavisphingomonas formosensis TaxID=861534 RepID=UPI0012F962AD|nr:SDR family oxidoreductase [Sphingomonas formosensis]
MDGRGTAVVLGASEEGGTGWTIAEALAAQGLHVVAGARRLASLERLAAKIGGTPVACDATDEAQVTAFIAAARDLGGGVIEHAARSLSEGGSIC